MSEATNKTNDTLTPEGWERREKFLFRQYGEGFATIVQDDQEDWAVNVSLPDGGSIQDWYGSLDKAIAEANEQLGIPKPVEVVEQWFADGSVLIRDSENKRSAFVWSIGGFWWSSTRKNASFSTRDDALEAPRAYVRGEA